MEETAEAGAALVGGLSVRQVRYYVQLPQMSGGFWLDAGADMKALLGVKTDKDVEVSDYEIEDAAGNVGKCFNRLEATGLFEFAPKPYGADSFKKPAPDTQHYPAGAVVVDVNLWREHLFKAGVLDPNASNPRADFKRLKDQLAERGLIGEWNSLMWAVDPTEGK